MKFFSVAAIAAMLSFSVTSFADNDMTMVGSLESNETKSVKVYIPVGDLKVEVYSTKDTNKFTCRFFDGAGNLGMEQQHSPKCGGNFTSLQHGYITVSIQNEQNKSVDYRIVLTKR